MLIGPQASLQLKFNNEGFNVVFFIPGVPQPELVLSETTRTSALPVTQGSDLALRDTLITRTRVATWQCGS